MPLLMEAGAGNYWLALGIFLLAYVGIVSERIDKTKVALLGGTLMILLPILTQEEAFHSKLFGIDYNVIFLLVGMMIMIGIMGRTGLFEWGAVRCAKLAKGDPKRILVAFVLVSAFSSALLDNVTTVLLLAPVTLLIAEELGIDPIPFLISEALAANIGGTATLIGDPPNIMIASKTGLTFVDFIVHMAPIVLVMIVALILIVRVVFGRTLRVDEQKRQRVLAMDENRLIRNRPLAWKSAIVIGLTTIGFALHGVFHIEPATIALTGGALLLLISGEDPEEIFHTIEWPTIFFFMGLFLIVGGIVKVGAVGDMSAAVVELTGPTADDMQTTALTMLWFSGIASAIVDNIPFVATMVPLVLDMANEVLAGGAEDPGNLPPEILQHPTLMPVWWAMALGACLGGNGSPIGASANVIVIGIAAKAGHRISFLRFVAFGAPVMMLTLAIAMVYVWLRYYVL